VCGPFVGVDDGGISLGDVVALRTRFGSEDFMAAEKKNSIAHAGAWAGDAFDITTLKRHEHQKRVELGFWTDVSDGVAQEMKMLWEKLNKCKY
jgi:hypothetical protein